MSKGPITTATMEDHWQKFWNETRNDTTISKDEYSRACFYFGTALVTTHIRNMLNDEKTSKKQLKKAMQLLEQNIYAARPPTRTH